MPLRRSRAKKGRSTTTTTAAAATTRESPGRDNAGWCAPTVCVRIRPALECETSSRGVGSGDDDHGRGEWNGSGVSTAELSSSSVVLDTASSLGAGFEKASSSSVMQYAVGVEEDPAPPIPPPPPSSPAAPSFSRVLCESLTLPSRRRRSRSGKKKHGFASISGKDVVAVDERQSYLSPPPPPPSIPSSSPKSPSSHLRWVASKALKGGGARGGGAGGGGMENIEPSSPLQSPSSSLFRSVIAATEEGEGSTPTSTSTSASAWWYPDVDGRTVHCRGSTPASESSAPATTPSHGPRPQHHVFDAVHPPSSTNERLYASHVRPLVVSSVRDGYDAVVLAVGPRGGGKTRCLVGASKDDPGLLPLAILDLFAKATEAENEATGAVAAAAPSPRDSSKVPSPWKRHMSLGKGKKTIKKRGPKAVSPPRVGRKRHRVTMSCVRVVGGSGGAVQDCLLPPSPSENSLGGTTPSVCSSAASPTTLDCADSGEALATLHRALGRASHFASAEARRREDEVLKEAPFKDESDAAAGGIRVDNNGDGRSDAGGAPPRERSAAGGGSAVVVRFAIDCTVTELDGDNHKARRRFVRTSALTFVDPSGWNDRGGGDADGGLREALEAAMADSSAKMSDLNSFRRLVLEEGDKENKTETTHVDTEVELSSLEDYRLPRLLRPASLRRSRVAIVCALAPPPAPPPMPTTPDESPIPVSFFSSSAASEDSAERIKAAAASASAIEALEFASRLRASLRLHPRPRPLRPELTPAVQSPFTPMETAEARRYEAEIQSLRRQLAERRDEEAETKRRAALEEELERSRAEVERLRTEMNEIVTAPTSGSGRLNFLSNRGTPKADGSSHNDDSESNALVDKCNGDNDMEAALREQRLEDAVKHVDNAILRIARAHDIDLSPLLKMNSSAGGGSNLGAVLAATTAGGGAAALPATGGSVAEEDKSGLFLDDGRRIDKKGTDVENKDKDDEDDDDESGWEGVGAMGALLEEDDDAFSGSQSFGGSRGDDHRSWHSSSSFSSRRRLAVASAMSAGPGSSRASRGGGSSKRSGSSSSTAALMRRSADRARLRTAASSNSADGAAVRASSASPSLIGREGGGIGEKEEESPIDFDEWEKRTFATAEEGSVSNWFGGDGGKGGGFGGDDDLDSWDEDDFHSIHSRVQGTDPSGFPTSPLVASSPPRLLPPRESLLPSRRLRRSAAGSYKGEALLTARRRRREAEERLKFAFGRSAVKSQDDDDDDDALSVVSDAVSSLTSATTLFGRGADRHGGSGDLAHRDPAVVVGELWRIQGLLRAAISKDHDGFPATSALERNSFRWQNGGTPRPGERWAK